jgi:alkylhydroperoxidase family enzyme
VIIGEVSRKDAIDAVMLACCDSVFGPDRDPTVDRGTATGSRDTYWTVIANSPDTLRLVNKASRLMDHGEGRFRLLKELGLVRACWARGSKFTHSQHCKFLRKLDSSQEKIAGLRYWRHSERYLSSG